MSDIQTQNQKLQNPAAGGTEQPAAVGAGAAAGDDPAAAAEGNTPEQPLKIYRPEGLPDHLVGKSDQETIDKLFKTVDGFRKQQSKDKGMPEKIDDYKIDLPEELAKNVLVLGEDGKDPVFETMRQVLFEKNISADAAVEITQKLYESVAAIKSADKGDGQSSQDDTDWEYKNLGGQEKAKPIVDASQTWINGLKQAGKISESAANELALLTYHGQGLKALAELRAAMTGEKIPASDLMASADNGKITQETLNERVADPRYRKGSKNYDPQFYEETVEMFKRFYAEPA